MEDDFDRVVAGVEKATVPQVSALRNALEGDQMVVTTGLVLQELLQGFAGSRARKDLTWERAAQPLLAFCQNPQPAADKTHGCAQVSDQEQPAEELAGLRALVRAYESGRFIRFTRWLHGLRHKE